MSEVKNKEKTPSGDLVTVYSSLGKGRHECEQCGRIIGARVLECVCGNRKDSSQGEKSEEYQAQSIPDNHIELVIKATSWLDEHGETQTPEIFFGSLGLSWETIDQINSVEELKELKKRKEWALFMEQCGGIDDAVSLVRRVQSFCGNESGKRKGGAQ
jgi:hypothetical protein